MSYTCSECGGEFKTEGGRTSHYNKIHDPDEEKPWHDPELLERLYWGREMNLSAMAERFGCGVGTVHRAMERWGIERREQAVAMQLPFARYYTNHKGYEYWRAHPRIDDGWCFPVHRLMAIAEYGFDAVAGNVVHHGVESERLPAAQIPWANWPGNIEVLSNSDHMSRHQQERVDDLIFGEDGCIIGYER